MNLVEQWIGKILSYLTKFASQGVIYSKHKCFNSIFDTRNPCMHSSRNSNVKCGSLVASFSLTDLINIVLFDGMQRPTMQ